jgi:hypothetical protein
MPRFAFLPTRVTLTAPTRLPALVAYGKDDRYRYALCLMNVTHHFEQYQEVASHISQHGESYVGLEAKIGSLSYLWGVYAYHKQTHSARDILRCPKLFLEVRSLNFCYADL